MNLIFARARNGVIGKQGAMPWHLPEDLAHFKHTTLGAPVIMGRKTWDSLPARFRPLPGRLNIVVTRNADWQPQPTAADVRRAASLEAALELCAGASQAWVIGGADILEAALPLAGRAIVTEIDVDFDGDTYAPDLGPNWTEIVRENRLSGTGVPFSFVTYENIEKRKPHHAAPRTP